MIYPFSKQWKRRSYLLALGLMFLALVALPGCQSMMNARSNRAKQAAMEKYSCGEPTPVGTARGVRAEERP